MNKPETVLSIIIPCRNEGQFIGRCLDSILSNDYDLDLIEILVIDGMSQDNTREIILEYALRYNFIQLLENPSRITPTALNIGLEKASGSIIMRIDAHAEYSNNYLSILVQRLSELNADNVGGIWIIQPYKKGLIPEAIAIASASPFGVGNAWYRIGTNKIMKVDTVPFGCYSRTVFDRIGNFDEDLIRNQDDEFNARLIKNGGSIYLIPEARITYYARSSIPEITKMFFQYGLYKPMVNFKLNKVTTWRQLIPISFVVYLMIVLMVILFVPEPVHRLLALIPFGLYLLINLLFSMKYAFVRREFKYVIILPLIFFLIHFGYGLGYLSGMFRLAIWKPDRTR